VDKLQILLDLMAREKMKPQLTDLRPQKQNSGTEARALEINKTRAREVLLRIQLNNSKIPINSK
jgi:hypothetical protein